MSMELRAVETLGAPQFDRVLSLIAVGGLVVLIGCSPVDSPEKASSSDNQPVPLETKQILAEAQKYFQDGQYVAALRLSEKARSSAPSNSNLAPVYLLKGRVLIRLKKYDRAQDVLRRAIGYQSNYPRAWYLLGQTAFQQAKFRNALSYYCKEKFVTPALYVQMGRSYLELGKLDSARLFLNKAINNDSDFAPAYRYLGEVHKISGNLSNALDSFEKADSLSRENPEINYLLGSVHLRQGNLKTAIQNLQETLRRSPNHLGAHHLMGKVLRRQGQMDSAAYYFQRSSKLEKEERRIERLRSEALVYDSQPRRWIRLAEALENLGHKKEATQAYTIAEYVRREESHTQ